MIFTVDYVTRLLLCHVRAKGCVGGLLYTFRYAKEPMNLIDLFAIMPYYMSFVITDTGGVARSVSRLLRLCRVLRLLKMAKHNKSIAVFAEVLVMSGQPLLILMVLNVIIVVLFASLIFYAEGTRYSVAPEFTGSVHGRMSNVTVPGQYPTGAFVRLGKSMEGDELSPFRSIPYGIWWVTTTMTTVGYGDLYPSTRLGKFIGVCSFYVGIIFLALPISVLGCNFESVYNRNMTYRDPRTVLGRRDRSVEEPNLRLFPVAIGLRKKIFILFENPQACVLGPFISLFVLLTILVSTAAFVMETIPDFNSTPSTCDREKLNADECRPVPADFFWPMEIVCITIFTIEYVARFVTVHAVSAQECGVKDPTGNMSPLAIMRSYCLQPLNLVDFFAIVPFYVEQFLGSAAAGVAVLRVLRLVRIFRVLRNPKLKSGASMFINVMIDSLPAIFMLVFMTSMTAVLVASLLVFAETSVYSVDEFPEDYPYGVYIRPTVDGYAQEPSPFRSIPYTCWWFFVTATTVGYGDDFPTTTLGRMVGMVAFYQGIVLLALPITIVGGNFNNYYHLWIEEFCSTPGDEEDEDIEGDDEVWLVRHPTSTDSLTSPRCGKVPQRQDDASHVAMNCCLPPTWDLVDLAEKEVVNAGSRATSNGDSFLEGHTADASVPIFPAAKKQIEVAGEQGATSPQPLRHFEDPPIRPNVPDIIPT